MEVRTLGQVMPLGQVADQEGEVFVLSLQDRDTLHHEMQYLYAVRNQAKALLESIADEDEPGDEPPDALKALRWLLETARVYQ